MSYQFPDNLQDAIKQVAENLEDRMGQLLFVSNGTVEEGNTVISLGKKVEPLIAPQPSVRGEEKVMDAIRYAMNSLIPMIQRRDMLANRPRYETNKERDNPAY